LSWFAEFISQEAVFLLRDWLNRKLGWTKQKTVKTAATKPKRKRRPKRTKKVGK
jgi:hypothetical protein